MRRPKEPRPENRRSGQPEAGVLPTRFPHSDPNPRPLGPRRPDSRPEPGPRRQTAIQPGLTRSMWEKPVSTRFFSSSQPIPPAPTTSTRPPDTASASSRGNPRDSAMAGRPRAAAQSEAGEPSGSRKSVGEGRHSFRSCALRPPARPEMGPGDTLMPGITSHTIPEEQGTALRLRCLGSPSKDLGLNSQPKILI